MGIIGDLIRDLREGAGVFYKECGLEDVEDEIKDIWKSLKGD